MDDSPKEIRLCDCQEQFRILAREAKAEALVFHGTNAAKSYVSYSRALSSSQRAQTMIGEGAGNERAWEAEQHFRARTANLRDLAEAVEAFKESAGASEVVQANERISQGAVRELVADARHVVISTLLESDISAGQAREALAVLNQRSEDVESASSFEQLTELLRRHVDDLAARPYGNPALDSGQCIFILLMSSMLLFLIIIAALICIFTGGCERILRSLIIFVCSLMA
jgi:hypothetical protein